jgi:hypothetical protein
MKIRTGFISNSSSSSFVVIKNTGSFHNVREDEFCCKGGTLVVDGSQGNLEFGWEWTRYDNFWDKLHFAYIQARYMDSEAMDSPYGDKKPPFDKKSDVGLKILEEILKEELGVLDIEWKIDPEAHWDSPYRCYIDHQSAIYEGQNGEIFESKEVLKSFLFDIGSFIQGGNDNS